PRSGNVAVCRVFGPGYAAGTRKCGEGAMSALLAAAGRTGGLVSIVITLGASPGFAEAQSPAWLDPTLLEAAKREGSVVVYTSTNEREGLPLFKIFEDATGIKVHY